MAHGSMIQKSIARITPWLIILALLLLILGCGGGTGENMQAKGGLGSPVVIGPPETPTPSDTTPPPGTPVYSVTLAWDPPTTNVDGSPLTNLAGYWLYYGISSGVFTSNVDIGNVTSYTVPNLPYGTYYFAVKAYNSSSNFSDYSAPTYGLCVNVSATPTICPY